MARKNFHHPFEPYEIQQQFMEAVYACIEQGKVGIFESPTGTGKSLSLICGSLTWLREHKRKKFDEAMAAVEVEDDDPDWMKEHARQARSREIRQLRDDLEARLAAVRKREQKVRERLANGEPAFKRQRQSKESAQTTEDVEQFLLEDYESDDEQRVDKKAQYSAETAKLMEKLGLMPKDQDRHDQDDLDETKIYFCSRTHSQLSQFVGELQRVELPPGLPQDGKDWTNSGNARQPTEALRHLTLGSRKNLCINPRVNKLSSQVAINERCIELQQSNVSAEKKCQYLPNKDSEDQVLDFRDHALAKIRDIEDLAALGSRLQICPYYASRPGIGPAEMVTLPYPLLLQKAAREALGISLKGHVVVIDEAHNLMNAVEGIYSVQVTETQLRRAKDGLIVYLQKFRNRLKGSNRSYVAQVVRTIDSLISFINGVKSQSNPGAVTSSSALLAGKAVDQINLAKLVRYIGESKLARKVEGYASYIQQTESKKQDTISARETVTADVPTLTHVQNFLMALMNPSREGRFMWSRAGDAVTIQYLLLDPSEHFREIVAEARAVILAGGTMSPMDDYKEQLFPYLDSITTFSCGHLIPSSSLFVRAVTSDRNERFDFSYKSRTTASAIRLGKAIDQIRNAVKGGTVVFFPSYGYLDTVIRTWKTEGLMTQLEKTGSVFFDSRAVSAEDTFRAYSEAVRTNESQGALLLSVIGGKLSEGINFSDDLGRCVVVVGLPYPNLETPEWKAKLQYLEESAAARGESKGKASREHAENVCMRSVNQAIGRAIRHKNDWASILLFDARYADSRIQGKLPGWIRKNCVAGASDTLEDIVQDLGAFFERKSV